MNLEQLESERNRTTRLIHRLKGLQELNKTLQDSDDNLLNAAHQALSMASSERCMAVVAAMVCTLMEMEAKSLAEAGVEFPWHNHFPGVVFYGSSVAEREQGSPIGKLTFEPGFDGAVARALEHMKAANGYFKFNDDGSLEFQISQDRRYVLPTTASLTVHREGGGTPE